MQKTRMAMVAMVGGMLLGATALSPVPTAALNSLRVPAAQALARQHSPPKAVPSDNIGIRKFANHSPRLGGARSKSPPERHRSNRGVKRKAQLRAKQRRLKAA